MKKLFYGAAALLVLISCKEDDKKQVNMAMTYPQTKKVDTVDEVCVKSEVRSEKYSVSKIHYIITSINHYIII